MPSQLATCGLNQRVVNELTEFGARFLIIGPC